MRRGMLAILVLLTVALVAAGVVFVVQQRAVPPTATAIPGSTEAVPRIAVAELRGQLATSSPPLVWDLRPVVTFAEGHIPGSRAMTFDVLPDAAANVDRRQPIVTVCA